MLSLANENRPNVANEIRRRDNSDRNKRDWKKVGGGERSVSCGGAIFHHHHGIVGKVPESIANNFNKQWKYSDYFETFFFST